MHLEYILMDIADVRLAEQIPPVLERIAQAYGLGSVAYLGTGTLGSGRHPREPFLAVTYSSEWVDHYRARGYVKIDPVIRTGLRRVLPIDWGEFDRSDTPLRQFFGEASEFGLGRKGMSFPIHGHRGDRALLSISADMSEREWEWARRTSFRQFPVIAAHLHDAVLRIEGILRPRPRISPREFECLQWTAAGKTAWECGIILGLAPRTVRFYLESARHKLGASSTTHAVSIALHSGILFEFP